MSDWERVEPAVALDAKYPEWLLFLVTHDGAGRHNLMPAGWAMQAAEEPPMLAVALRAARYSLQQVRATREFAVGFAGPEQVELITWAGTRSGADLDKFAAAGLGWSPGVATGCALVDGCAAMYECRLAGELAAGDHVIVTGEVLAAHRAAPPLANLVNFGGWYAPATPAWPHPPEA